MRTLEEILEKEASEMIAARDAINKMVADSKIDMPRLVTLPAWYDEDDAREHGVCPDCSGTGCYVCHYEGEI